MKELLAFDNNGPPEWIIRNVQLQNKRVKVNAFVVMDNHIHLIWQMMGDIKPQAVQRDFMRYPALTALILLKLSLF